MLLTLSLNTTPLVNRFADISNDDMSMAVQAAWLHDRGGLTQAAVAERLGVASVKAHRLIACAMADGMINFSVDGEIVECVANKICIGHLRYDE